MRKKHNKFFICILLMISMVISQIANLTVYADHTMAENTGTEASGIISEENSQSAEASEETEISVIPETQESAAQEPESTEESELQETEWDETEAESVTEDPVITLQNIMDFEDPYVEVKDKDISVLSEDESYYLMVLMRYMYVKELIIKGNIDEVSIDTYIDTVRNYNSKKSIPGELSEEQIKAYNDAAFNYLPVEDRCAVYVKDGNERPVTDLTIYAEYLQTMTSWNIAVVLERMEEIDVSSDEILAKTLDPFKHYINVVFGREYISDFSNFDESGYDAYKNIQIYAAEKDKVTDYFPESLNVITDQNGEIEIPVSWECSEDFQGTSYDLYTFELVLSSEYSVSNELKRKLDDHKAIFPFIDVEVKDAVDQDPEAKPEEDIQIEDEKNDETVEDSNDQSSNEDNKAESEPETTEEATEEATEDVNETLENDDTEEYHIYIGFENDCKLYINGENNEADAKPGDKIKVELECDLSFEPSLKIKTEGGNNVDIEKLGINKKSKCEFSFIMPKENVTLYGSIIQESGKGNLLYNFLQLSNKKSSQLLTLNKQSTSLFTMVNDTISVSSVTTEYNNELINNRGWSMPTHVYHLSNGIQGVCVMHEKNGPWAGMTLTVSDIYDGYNKKNETLRKVLYYGYGGPAQLSNAYYPYTAVAASVANGHSDQWENSTKSYVGQTLINSLASRPAPPDNYRVYILHANGYDLQDLAYGKLVNGSFNLNILLPDGSEPYNTGAAGSIEMSVNGGAWTRLYNEPASSYPYGTTFKFRNFWPGTGMYLSSTGGVTQNSDGTWSATMGESGLTVSFSTSWASYGFDLNIFSPSGVQDFASGTVEISINGGSWTRVNNELASSYTYGTTFKFRNFSPGTGMYLSSVAGVTQNSDGTWSGTMGTSGLYANFYTSWATYTNTIRHWKYVGTGGDNGDGTYKNMGATTFTASYATTVTIPSSHIQSYTGYYNNGVCGSNWGTGTWTGKSIGSTFTQPAGNVYMEYYYLPNTYILTINPNGGILNGSNFGASNGTGNNAEVTVTYDKNYYYGLGIATRTGYTFNGWYTAPSGGTQVFDSSGTAVPGTAYYDSFYLWKYTGNLTVYAQWTKCFYIMDYNPDYNNYGTIYENGARVKTLDLSIITSDGIEVYNKNGISDYCENWNDYDGTYYFTNVKYRTGYHYAGYTLANDPDARTSNLQMIKATGTEFTFKHSTPGTIWFSINTAPNTYTVKYDANKPSNSSGAITGTMNDSSHTYDKAQNLSTNCYSIPGWTFTGWNTKADGSGTSYTDGASIKNLTAVDGDTITLYAQWTENELTVFYYSNYATVSFQDPMNAVNGNVNVVVAEHKYKYDTQYTNGLSDYVESTTSMYLARSGYTGTGYWGTEESGGYKVNERTSFDSGEALANALGQTLANGNVSINIYPQWDKAPELSQTDIPVFYENQEITRAMLLSNITVSDLEDDAAGIAVSVLIKSIRYDDGIVIEKTYDSGMGDDDIFKITFDEMGKGKDDGNQVLLVKYQATDSIGNVTEVEFPMEIRWNEFPTIKAFDKSYLLTEVNNGLLTEDTLLSLADPEDIEDASFGLNIKDSLEVIDYDENQFKASGTVLVTYYVKDSLGKETTKSITISIIDETSVVVPEMSSEVRFISADYYNKPENEGGLNAESKWRKNPEYAAVLNAAFANIKDDSGNWTSVDQCWKFSADEVKTIREELSGTGIGNSRNEGSLSSFVSRYAANRIN